MTSYDRSKTSESRSFDVLKKEVRHDRTVGIYQEILVHSFSEDGEIFAVCVCRVGRDIEEGGVIRSDVLTVMEIVSEPRASVYTVTRA